MKQVAKAVLYIRACLVRLRVRMILGEVVWWIRNLAHLGKQRKP
jgi:hypothetical protein